MRIFGVKPAMEALRAGRVTALTVSARRQRGLAALLELADSRRVRPRWVERAELDRLAGGAAHQGVVATVRAPDVCSVADLLAVRTPPLVVVLDGIEDPRNLGAIARTVDAAGGSGLVVPERRAAPVTGSAVKASAGALVHVPVARVVNLVRALEELKAAGVWTIGLDAEADTSLYELDLRLPSAFRGRPRRAGPAPAGARAVRLACRVADAGAGIEPERIRGGRRGVVRGRAAAYGRHAAGLRRPVREGPPRRGAAAGCASGGLVAPGSLWYTHQFVRLA